MEDFKGAIEAYKKVLELDPEDDITWEDLSLALKKVGDLKGALDAQNKASSLRNNH